MLAAAWAAILGLTVVGREVVMKSWWIWVAAGVVAATPAMAREHRSGSHSGGSGGSHHSSGGHSGGGEASRSHDSGGSRSSGGYSGGGSHSGGYHSRGGDSYSSAPRRSPSSYDSRGRGTSSRHYAPSYDYRPRASYSYSYRSRYHRPLSFYYRYRPAYYYNYHFYRPWYVYGGSYYDYDYSYDVDGAVRVLVEPSETAVYVDGDYVGVADDFDGLFQRLYLQPGRHEIALKLAGFRTWRADVYASAGHTIKLHHDMIRGSGPEEIERLSTNPDDEDGAADGGATLHLNVQPRDAAVYIDGEPCNLAQTDIPVPEGVHRVEVVRPGYRSAEREFEARPGKTVDLRVDLLKSESRATESR
jgi:hypothetical protein